MKCQLKVNVPNLCQYLEIAIDGLVGNGWKDGAIGNRSRVILMLDQHNGLLQHEHCLQFIRFAAVDGTPEFPRGDDIKILHGKLHHIGKCKTGIAAEMDVG